jgi:hypothetical protein
MTENSYHGNPNLKTVGHQHEFTAQQIQEIVKCQADPVYFIEQYCYIVSLDKGLVKFQLYECQKKKVNVILNNRKVVLMEGRQQGKTVTAAACILWYTLFQENKTVAILANKGSAAREVLDRYQIMYENIPLWMQQGVRTWNKGNVELENGSKVFTSATTTSGIRGKSVNWLYIDEASIIPNNVADQFFASVYPTISAGVTTKVLLTSTPLLSPLIQTLSSILVRFKILYFVQNFKESKAKREGDASTYPVCSGYGYDYRYNYGYGYGYGSCHRLYAYGHGHSYCYD